MLNELVAGQNASLFFQNIENALENSNEDM